MSFLPPNSLQFPPLKDSFNFTNDSKVHLEENDLVGKLWNSRGVRLLWRYTCSTARRFEGVPLAPMHTGEQNIDLCVEDWALHPLTRPLPLPRWTVAKTDTCGEMFLRASWRIRKNWKQTNTSRKGFQTLSPSIKRPSLYSLSCIQD